MADRFHEGQRVRSVFTSTGIVPIGTHGTVRRERKLRHDLINKTTFLAYVVEFDGYQSTLGTLKPGFLCQESWLEPIPDDRSAFERFMVRVVEPRKVVSVIRTDKATAK